MKTCIDCNRSKPRSAFYRNCSAKDGLQSRCKACDNRGRAARARGEIGTRENFVEHSVRASRRDMVLLHRGDYVGVTGGPLLYGYTR